MMNMPPYYPTRADASAPDLEQGVPSESISAPTTVGYLDPTSNKAFSQHVDEVSSLCWTSCSTMPAWCLLELMSCPVRKKWYWKLWMHQVLACSQQ